MTLIIEMNEPLFLHALNLQGFMAPNFMTWGVPPQYRLWTFGFRPEGYLILPSKD